MYNGTTCNNPEPQKSLNLDEMKALIDKYQGEREDHPEAMLMSETAWMNLRDFTPIQNLGATKMLFHPLVHMEVFRPKESILKSIFKHEARKELNAFMEEMKAYEQQRLLSVLKHLIGGQ